MKKRFARLGIVLLSLIVLAGAVWAQGMGVQNLPGAGWWSAEQLQNVGTTTANVQAEAFDMDSTSTWGTTPASFTIDRYKSVTILPEEFGIEPYFGGMTGKRGSVVVSSDQPLVAIVNVTNRRSGTLGVTGGYAAAMYEGVGGGAVGTQLNFPMFKKSYFGGTTAYFVQNVGGSPATINATFYPDSGSPVSWSSAAPIDPSYAVMIVPPASIANGTKGSAVVTASPTSNLAGTHVEHEAAATVATILKATKAFVPADGDAKLYAPEYKKVYYARSSAIQVQNASASGSVEVTVNYGCVDLCTADFSVVKTIANPGESWNFFAGDADHGSMTNGLYSAVVEVTGGTATAPEIVALVDQTYVDGRSPNRRTTYSAIPDKNAGTLLSCPVVKERFFDNGGGILVYNAGAADDTNVILTYSNSNGDYTTLAQTIDQGASKVFFDVAQKPGLWSGSAVGSSTNNAVIIQTNEPTVATVNENIHFTSSAQQDAKQYSCFPLQ
jgi:hypothetical protein